VYEDLNDVARLKFVKEMESIAAQTRQNLQDAANRFAATAGAGTNLVAAGGTRLAPSLFVSSNVQ